MCSYFIKEPSQKNLVSSFNKPRDEVKKPDFKNMTVKSDFNFDFAQT